MERIYKFGPGGARSRPFREVDGDRRGWGWGGQGEREGGVTLGTELWIL